MVNDADKTRMMAAVHKEDIMMISINKENHEKEMDEEGSDFCYEKRKRR